MTEHLKNKHLTYEEREYIEIGLNKGRNFTKIAKDINKDRTTISKEVLKHRFKKSKSKFNNTKNLCKNRQICKKFDCTKKLPCYEEEICLQLTGAPYVCNGCINKTNCRKIKYYYYAKFANDEYRENLVNARVGINLTKSQAYELDKLISPLIKEKKQSISHIYANHPDELYFSRPTFYTYVNLGVFSFRNIDLPRKVRYHPRKDTTKQRIRKEASVRIGRTYEEFKEYITKNPEASIVEMDTVEGVKGGKVFLTLLFRQSKFMLIYLLENKTMECVGKVFKELKRELGDEMFSKLFEVILTDNGSEFLNPMSIEKSEDSKKVLVHLFYCDPGASWQKGSIEKNHEYIRYILPKGKSFEHLTQEKVSILASHINSTSRDSLNGNCPYEAVKLLVEQDIVNKIFKIQKIKADDVNLSPKLLKGDKTYEMDKLL